MKKLIGMNITGLPDMTTDPWLEPPSYQETFGHIKKPDSPIDNIILTCNPTGLNIFHKNFINNLNNQENGK